MLEPPRHLLATNQQTPQIRFAWDDWDTEAVEERPDDALIEALGRISDRAVVALTNGMAEWIVHRFEPLNDDRRPWRFLEAAWAADVDWAYLSETWDAVTGDENWSGPIKGPLSATMMGVDQVISAARVGEDLTDGARWVSNIAMHVLPQPEPFRIWRDRALERLAMLYPRREDDLIGDVVPREALDMGRELNVFETEALVNVFLRSIDPQGHPFLATVDQLIEGGFSVRPYVFDITRDREERLFK